MDLPQFPKALDPTVIGLAAGALALVAILVLFAVWTGQRRLLHRYRRLLFGPKGEELEAILLRQAATIDALRDRLQVAEQTLERHAAAAVMNLQHVGVVRFQAFPEMGSDLSFSIAVLDGNRNGFVLTSLYGRSETRVYAKPIANGKSTYVLSDEERTALAQSLGKEG